MSTPVRDIQTVTSAGESVQALPAGVVFRDAVTHVDERGAVVELYDEREDSPTRGLVAKVVLSEHRRRLMSIPAGVWHPSRTLGQRDAVLVNFPTMAYDHANPDKYRLPLNDPRIPYRFETTLGF